MKKLLTIILLLSLTTPSFAEQWLCVVEQGTGFSQNASGKWITKNIDVYERFVINKKSGKWVWNGLHENEIYQISECTNFDESGFMECSIFEIIEIRFNKNSLRFLFIHKPGYVISNLDDENSSMPFSPYMMIGKCSGF